MAKKKPADSAAAVEMPAWFKPLVHRVEPRGIVLAATGDLLAEDGLPVNAHARLAVTAKARALAAHAPAAPAAAAVPATPPTETTEAAPAPRFEQE